MHRTGSTKSRSWWDDRNPLNNVKHLSRVSVTRSREIAATERSTNKRLPATASVIPSMASLTLTTENRIALNRREAWNFVKLSLIFSVD
jgi:hypothetical protein